MSEEEIIKEFKDLIYNPDYDEILLRCEDGFTGWHELFENVLDLYNKEKEKNKELENCLQMAKQIMTADISEDFDCMKLKEFKEYLLNEIKLNENLEE